MAESVEADKEFFKKLHREVNDGAGRKVTGEELERILGMMNKRDFGLYPIPLAYGEGVGVVYLNEELPGILTSERLFVSSFRDLPEGTFWGRLSGIYMAPRNLEILELARITLPVPEQSMYEY